MPVLKVNHKIWEAMNKPQPIIVLISGRGAGKSVGVGDVLTFEMDTKGYDIYCLREFQLSLEDSVHKVFKGSIQKRLELQGWTITDTYVKAPNGAKTTYRGAARNPDNIQSAQDYMRSWFEEAHTISQESLDKLLPTIIRNPGAKCIFTANPQSSNDAFSQRFITPYLSQLNSQGFYEDDLHYICKTSWRDNPWWNAELEMLRAWDYQNLPRAKYDWIWEGAFNDTVENSIILPEWFDACIDAHIKLGIKPTGAVMAAHDPSDTGPDSKGYAMRHGIAVLDVQEMLTGNVNEGADWALGLARNARVDHFTWDCDGLGVTLNRQVSEAFRGTNTNITMFKGSESPDTPDAVYEPTNGQHIKDVKRWKDVAKNKRAQYYLKLKDRVYDTYLAIESGKYVDADNLISFSSSIKCLQTLRSELCKMPTKTNGVGKFELYAKDEMKIKFKFKSPNLADSVMMLMRQPVQVFNNYVIPQPIRPMLRR
jgi:phage terminase large subunit